MVEPFRPGMYILGSVRPSMPASITRIQSRVNLWLKRVATARPAVPPPITIWRFQLESIELMDFGLSYKIIAGQATGTELRPFLARGGEAVGQSEEAEEASQKARKSSRGKGLKHCH